MKKPYDIVTGAFGFTGRYIAQKLLDSGRHVRTLTNSINREDPFSGKVEVMPLRFDDHGLLVRSLRGATVLYNTYWVRFNHRRFNHAIAVGNTARLFKAAKEAGVKRVVHISVTNPSLDSNLSYFRGKAEQERLLKGSGIPYSIIRPALIYGLGDILINNIAWMLRRFPVMGIFGRGDYRICPIHAADLAALAVAHGKKRGNLTVNAVGRDVFTYKELVNAIGDNIGRKRLLVPIHPEAALLVGFFIGLPVNDVIINKEEIMGLMDDLLYVKAKPTGKTRFTEWLKNNRDTVGKRYAGELSRRHYSI